MAEGQKVASLYAAIGADTKSLQQGLDETKRGLLGAEAAAKSFQQKLQEQTRAVGFDFRNLRGDVDDWIGRVRSATPANEAYARSFAEITTAYNRGRLSAGETRTALENLRAEMARGKLEAGDYANAAIALSGAFAAIAAGGAIAIGSTTQLAARVETLGVVTATLGRNVGLTEPQIRSLEKAIQKKGITTQASRQAIAQMIQAEIDLAHATDIARLAQDAAVISGENSSQAFEALVTVIATGNVLMARRRGILVDFQGAYEREAKALGRSVESLSEQEKVTIRVNEVMRQGANITGSYEAAMETAGKQAASLARLQEEAALAIGNAFLPAYRDAIGAATQALTAFNDLETEQKEGVGTAIGYATAIAGVNAVTFAGIGTYLKAASALNTMAGAMGLASASALLLNVALPLTAITAMVIANYKLNQATDQAVEAAEDQLKAVTANAGGLVSATSATDAYIRKQKELTDAFRAEHPFLAARAEAHGKSISLIGDLEPAIRGLSSGYKDYITNLERAAKAEGLLIDAEGNLVRKLDGRAGVTSTVLQANFALTESNYELARSVEAVIEAFGREDDPHERRRMEAQGLVERAPVPGADHAEILKRKFEDLQLFMAGPLGEEFKKYGETQIELVTKARELQAALSELEGMAPTEGVADAMEEVKFQLDEVNFALEQNAAVHDETTRRIIFNLMLQRAELANLTDAQREEFFTMANEIAFAWGLIDEVTFQSVRNIDTAFRALASGSSLDEVKAKILSIGDAAAAISGDYFIDFIVTVHGLDKMDELGEKIARKKLIDARTRAGITGRIELPEQPPRRGVSARDFLGSGGGGAAKAEKAAAPKKTRLEKLMETAGALSQLGGVAIERVKKEIEPFQAQVEAIDKLLSPGHADLAAIERSAELQRQRAEAAAKVAEAEERILKLQEQQSRLQFLEAQVRLLDIIKENKLNAKNVLGGLKLGLDTDMNEVIEATTRAMAELIEKAEKELGVSSPSWKFEAMGEFSVAGLEKGWTANIDRVRQMFGKDLGEIASPKMSVKPMVAIEQTWLDEIERTEGAVEVPVAFARPEALALEQQPVNVPVILEQPEALRLSEQPLEIPARVLPPDTRAIDELLQIPDETRKLIRFDVGLQDDSAAQLMERLDRGSGQAERRLDIRPMVEIERGWLDELDRLIPDSLLEKTILVDVALREGAEARWQTQVAEMQTDAAGRAAQMAAPLVNTPPTTSGGGPMRAGEMLPVPPWYGEQPKQINVTVEIGNINDKIDVEQMARRVAQVIDYRTR